MPYEQTKDMIGKREPLIDSRIGENGLFDFEQFDVKDELRVGGDTGQSFLAVCEVRGDGDAALATGGHASDTDVPALDDLALAELEGEWLAFFVGYEEIELVTKRLTASW